MTPSALSSRSLANAALAALATFLSIVIALDIVQRGQYHPLSAAVSQLADGRAGWLMWMAFCSLGTGFLCLAVLHRRLVQHSHVAPLLLTIAALMFYVSAVFHADPENAITTSLHDQIHQTAGLIAFASIIVAMFVSSRRFRCDPRWQRLARPTLIWAVCTLGALFLVPALGDGLFGLAQRIFIACWLSWAITAAAHARSTAADSAELIAEPREARPQRRRLLPLR